jgi:hypothetical protein
LASTVRPVLSTRRLRTVFATAVLLITAASCSSYVCSAATCAAGCCENNSCYDGVAGHTGGISCDATVGSGGGSSTGGGTGGGGTSTGGGTGTGGGGGSCGTYDDPCNSSLPCCAPSGMYGYFCNSTRERCDMCGGAGYDCSDQYSEPCCPGFNCLLKQGFTQVYECQ